MTSPAHNSYREYYREIELHWCWRREHQMIVSPIEFEAMERWHQAEVPLPVVLRAIDLFIEKKNKSPRRKTSLLLTQVDSTVQKVHREYDILHKGEGENEENGDLLGKKLAGIQRRLKKLVPEYPEHLAILEQSLAALKAVKVVDIVDVDTVDTELQQIEEMLIEALTASLSADELRYMREDIEEVLPEAEEPKLFARMLRDSIRDHFGLPRFNLL
ncbi:hypothetical protein [Acanthopleuribacter pedis]|uniref:Uncharacterized protein n=1 Tax=Acanthopleuribacter pedis TaxID=442870 RepID=A0A8J7U3A6_9BACT|nr:hypothetical protein [Acanthopleuribacter pedis]MBO1320193.1 hypothetical protein [Acanthopleuribacter pedis]